MTKNEFMKEFSDIVFDELEQQNLTPHDLCKRTGIYKGDIAAYLNRVKMPSEERIKLICQTLDMSNVTINKLVRERKELNPRNKIIDRYDYEEMFIEAVEERLEYYNMTLSDLANVTRISLIRLNGYMNHQATPGTSTIAKIDRYLPLNNATYHELIELRSRIK